MSEIRLKDLRKQREDLDKAQEMGYSIPSMLIYYLDNEIYKHTPKLKQVWKCKTCFKITQMQVKAYSLECCNKLAKKIWESK